MINLEINIKTKSKTLFFGNPTWVDNFMQMIDAQANPIGDKQLDDIAKIVRNASMEDLQNQVKPDGTALRDLTAFTWSKKKTPFKLIETGLLYNSYQWERAGKYERRIFIGGKRKQIAYDLQAGKVWTENGKTFTMKPFNFFGFGKNAESKVEDYLNNLDKKN